MCKIRKRTKNQTKKTNKHNYFLFLCFSVKEKEALTKPFSLYLELMSFCPLCIERFVSEGV